MNFDAKEKYIISRCVKRINERIFDEETILLLLILIRRHLGLKEFRIIRDLADLVAHRKRNRGIAADAMDAAKKAEYVTLDGSREIKGYTGYSLSEFYDELQGISDEIGIMINDRIKREIALCTLSLLQNTLYENEAVQGKMVLVQAKNCIAACTKENDESSPFIGFFVVDEINVRKDYSSSGFVINEMVITSRDSNGELALKAEDGSRIV